jgi:hypothetical protein
LFFVMTVIMGWGHSTSHRVTRERRLLQKESYKG